MKTIFITSFHGHISRNILHSDFLGFLEREGFKIVILVPDYKKKYFKGNFSGQNIIIEGIKPYQSSKTRLGLFFKNTAIYFLDSDTTRIKRKLKRRQGKFFHYFFYSAATFIGKLNIVRNIFRRLDYALCPKDFFDELIFRYKPSVIFSTDIQNENDVALAQDARKLKIPVLGMVRSWDNLSQRIFRVIPDKLLVGAETIKDEALELHGFPENKISIVGYPYYDRYVKGAPIHSKKDFFNKFRLDLQKKLILFAPIGDPTTIRKDIDQYVIGLLGKADAQVLVRLPTNLTVDLNNFAVSPNVVLDRPGQVFKRDQTDTGFLDNEISRADDDSLIDSIYWSDLVVAGPTSIILDAVLFDKPVVAVNFYPTKRHFLDGIYHYQYHHLKEILRTGGVHLSESEDDFFSATKEYLANPSKDKEARSVIRSKWLSHVDGKSSERIVGEIIEIF